MTPFSLSSGLGGGVGGNWAGSLEGTEGQGGGEWRSGTGPCLFKSRASTRVFTASLVTTPKVDKPKCPTDERMI